MHKVLSKTKKQFRSAFEFVNKQKCLFIVCATVFAPRAKRCWRISANGYVPRACYPNERKFLCFVLMNAPYNFV